MVAEQIDYSERLDLLITQWRANTTEGQLMRDLIDELLALVREQVVDVLQVLESSTKLATAEGIFLDYIGDRLGLKRPLTTDASVTGARLGYMGRDGAVGFDQAPMHSSDPALATRSAVGDEYYRAMLSARALALVGSGNAEDVDDACGKLFTGGADVSTSGAAAATIDATDTRGADYTTAVTPLLAALVGLSAGVTPTLS